LPRLLPSRGDASLASEALAMTCEEALRRGLTTERLKSTVREALIDRMRDL